MTSTTTNTETTTKTLDELRKDFAEAYSFLTYDGGKITRSLFACKAVDLAGVAPTEEGLDEEAKVERAAKIAHAAATKVSCACRRCAGTGSFITMVENGKPKGPGGPCFRCAGKGYQTAEDGRRNWGYDMYGQRISLF